MDEEGVLLPPSLHCLLIGSVPVLTSHNHLGIKNFILQQENCVFGSFCAFKVGFLGYFSLGTSPFGGHLFDCNSQVFKPAPKGHLALVRIFLDNLYKLRDRSEPPNIPCQLSLMPAEGEYTPSLPSRTIPVTRN